MSTDEERAPRIGVLAMQGAFAEHVRMLRACGAEASEVRTEAELAGVDALVLPGGESTAIRKALERAGLLEPLGALVHGGLPAFGTCAGLVVLADAAADGAPPCLGALDVMVERNGFGRQVHSFEAPVLLEGGCEVPGVFIRAPRIRSVGDGVRIIGRIGSGDAAGEPVVVAQGALVAASFHPELTGDATVHRMFVERVRESLRDAAPAGG